MDHSAQQHAGRSHEKMREVLMHPDAPGPAIHYHMIRGGSGARNITVWQPGTVGAEYIKTYGHYHVGALDEVYWTLQGEGVAIIQKRAEGADGPIDDEIEDAYAVHVRPGDALYMPPGWGHLVVNVGPTFFVTADDSPVDFGESDGVSLPGHADYEPVRRMRGFAYYVVDEAGKPRLVPNPLYRRAPDIRIIAAADYPLKRES
ncbi:glucose-6-phosphate isomerase [Enhydrobacter aerosaccus]|uniref:glucose-6-phosphate isomerase n=1 Tax=Enhydrobacter aerosaccus TaxID=225324 RepID=A0A1T4MT91_9HYPH|nr:glucose-6-phosphate isomerase family protein [Enhydrobacter aerosaccus]SJZ69868.1 glucose-6-phosphate isomerase [Enhydrobacter aerosaccus]